jgi:hypothetical protein
MTDERQNPFEVQPQGPPPPQWGGMTTLVPQAEGVPGAEGSSFALSPEAMQMLWAPQPQPPKPQPLV